MSMSFIVVTLDAPAPPNIVVVRTADEDEARQVATKYAAQTGVTCAVTVLDDVDIVTAESASAHLAIIAANAQLAAEHEAKRNALALAPPDIAPIPIK